MNHRTSISRRSFLKRTAATAAIAPLVLSGAFHSARAQPGRRITLGFIGMGRMGKSLLGTFLGFPDVQVAAIAEIAAVRLRDGISIVEKRYAADAASGTYKGCAGYGDFRELIGRDDIDAVVIATPDHWHAIPSILASRARKDIYCEKPLSLTIGEARAMADEARKNDIVYQTGSQQRCEFDGRFRLACELVRNGRIGQVHTIRVGVGEPARPCDLPEEPAPEGIDWNSWLGPAPLRGFNEILCPKGIHAHFPKWRDYREYAGGLLADMGAHHFDVAQWALDMDRSGPSEIIPPPGNATTGLVFKYANGVTMHHGGKPGVTFEGTEGVIYVDRPRLVSTPESIAAEPLDANAIRLENAGANHKRNWIDCIKSRRQPIANAETGARTATVCHLANIGYELRRTLRWNPATERFIDDPGADALIHRQNRAPWNI